MKIDVQLDCRPEDSEQAAVENAALGVDGLFSFEGAHDVFLPLALAARVADLDFLTNIAVALPRSPLHLAHLAYDMQSITKGRFRLGLGSQIRSHIENRYGGQWSRPAARMRETVAAIKAILDTWQYGTPLRFEGEFTRHTLMTPTFDPGPNRFGPPQVCLGALGPVMTRTAAEVADGLLVMPFGSRRHFGEVTVPAVEEGLARAGRTRADLAIYPQAIVAVGRTPEQLDAARHGVRRLLAFYGSTPAYRSVLEVEGWGGLQPRLHQLARRGEFDAMADLVDDAMLDTYAVAGTPEQCAIEIRSRFSAHADRVCCYFPGYSPSGQHIADLARAVKDSAA
ncbi:TIGR03617 family F420-dependent LLM class oxidoreductase [Nocardia sp. NPDC004711]